MPQRFMEHVGHGKADAARIVGGLRQPEPCWFEADGDGTVAIPAIPLRGEEKAHGREVGIALWVEVHVPSQSGPIVRFVFLRLKAVTGDEIGAEERAQEERDKVRKPRRGERADSESEGSTRDIRQPLPGDCSPARPHRTPIRCHRRGMPRGMSLTEA